QSLSFSLTPAPSYLYTRSLHDALPIFDPSVQSLFPGSRSLQSLPVHDILCCFFDLFEFLRSLSSLDPVHDTGADSQPCRHRGSRSEEHTSELQSRFDLVCRLLLEKKKI